MRLLVLGGTVFLSRAVASEAVARGHAVDAACRGVSGSLPDGVTHVPLDRSVAGATASALTDTYDAVVDVGRLPGQVAASVAATPSAHHVLVSTINVYPDTTTTAGGPDSLALHDALHDDEPGPDEDPTVAYGRRKVACEQAVAGAAGSWIVRPGLIVGPGDQTGRYSAWVARLVGTTAGEQVLAPGPPDEPVQVLDVRDLAGWLVSGAEDRRTGVVDAVGPIAGRGDALAAIARGVGADPSWVWADPDFLREHEVAPWAGPRSLALWLPPDHAGLMTHDPEPARRAGLRTRPAEETAADTAAWLETGGEVGAGLTRDEESELLALLRDR